jgi:hypothetical protein
MLRVFYLSAVMERQIPQCSAEESTEGKTPLDRGESHIRNWPH